MKEELTVEDPPLITNNIKKNDDMITQPVILKDVALGVFIKCCFLNCGLFTVPKINTLKGLGTNG